MQHSLMVIIHLSLMQNHVFLAEEVFTDISVHFSLEIFLEIFFKSSRNKISICSSSTTLIFLDFTWNQPQPCQGALEVVGGMYDDSGL